MSHLAVRVKRKFSRQRGRNRAPRAKTFSTEEAAKSWAKEQGFENFSVQNMKNDDAKKAKFRVVVEI